ncbi:MAG: hypothetical protein AVDCRST_MAG41-113, partial [uncultured Corynebacteriales bacterium]
DRRRLAPVRPGAAHAAAGAAAAVPRPARRPGGAGRGRGARPGGDAVHDAVDRPAPGRAGPVGAAVAVEVLGGAHPGRLVARPDRAGGRRGGRHPGAVGQGLRRPARGADRVLARSPAPGPGHRHRDAGGRAAPGVRRAGRGAGPVGGRAGQPGVPGGVGQARLHRGRHGPDRGPGPARRARPAPAGPGRLAGAPDRPGGGRRAGAVPPAARRRL